MTKEEAIALQAAVDEILALAVEKQSQIRGIVNGQPWKVEMMRLQETQAAKKATTTEVDPSGVRHAVAWRALWCVLARGPAATLLGWQERVVVPSKEHCMVALTRKDVIEISRPRWRRAGANRLGEPPKSHISVWSSPELLPQLVPLLPLGVQRGSPCPRTIPNIPTWPHSGMSAFPRTSICHSA
jgi:hypothetical protein